MNSFVYLVWLQKRKNPRTATSNGRIIVFELLVSYLLQGLNLKRENKGRKKKKVLKQKYIIRKKKKKNIVLFFYFINVKKNIVTGQAGRHFLRKVSVVLNNNKRIWL